jgi:hypothetical protein
MQENVRIRKKELANFKRLIIRGSQDHALVGPQKKQLQLSFVAAFLFYSIYPTLKIS